MNKTLARGNILFYGAYILYFTLCAIQNIQLLYNTPFLSMMELLKLFSVAVVIVKIFTEQIYQSKDFVCICAVMLLVFIACVCNRNLDLFYCVCFMIGLKDIVFSKVLFITFIIHMCIFAGMAVGIQTGIVQSQMYGAVVWAGTMLSEDSLGRYNLGFIHPNTASALVLFTTLIYMCIKKKCYFIDLVAVICVNYLVYQKTGSRTCFLITLVFLPLMYWFGNKLRLRKYWKVIFILSPLIIILTATFAQIFYTEDNLLLAKINQMLSGRLGLGHRGFLDYGVTLFGQKTLWVTNDNPYGLPYNYVDSAYMRILLENGIIVFILLCIITVVTMQRLVRTQNYKLCIAFLTLLVHSMVEVSIYNMSWGPFCLLMGQMGIIESGKELKYAKQEKGYL